MTGRTADPIKSPKEISHFADDLMTRTVLAPLFAALLAIAAWPALADSGLPVPRFVTLKGDEVNVRAGPGRRYPINWVFLRQEMPVEVVAEFDTWRKIRDFEGTEGWVHQSLLSGRRGALVLGEEIRDLRLDPEPGAPVVARAARLTSDWNSGGELLRAIVLQCLRSPRLGRDGIRWVAAAWPAGLHVLAALLVHRFRLDEAAHRQARREAEAR